MKRSKAKCARSQRGEKQLAKSQNCKGKVAKSTKVKQFAEKVAAKSELVKTEDTSRSNGKLSGIMDWMTND